VKRKKAGGKKRGRKVGLKANCLTGRKEEKQTLNVQEERKNECK